MAREARTPTCPTCGQKMHKVEGWKIEASHFRWSAYTKGAIAWYDDTDGEGGSLGESTASVSELVEAVRLYLEDRSSEHHGTVSFLAMEVAAHELAPVFAVDTPSAHRPIIWKKNARAALIVRAAAIAAAAVAAAQAGPADKKK